MNLWVKMVPKLKLRQIYLKLWYFEGAEYKFHIGILRFFNSKPKFPQIDRKTKTNLKLIKEKI